MRRRGFGLVGVAGSSMAPGLRDGDVVVVRWGAPARAGAVVVATLEGVLVVKRVTRISGGAVWLAGDNPAASDDSRVRGPVPGAAVAGRVVLRWRQAREADAREA